MHVTALSAFVFLPSAMLATAQYLDYDNTIFARDTSDSDFDLYIREADWDDLDIYSRDADADAEAEAQPDEEGLITNLQARKQILKCGPEDRVCTTPKSKFQAPSCHCKNQGRSKPLGQLIGKTPNLSKMPNILPRHAEAEADEEGLASRLNARKQILACGPENRVCEYPQGQLGVPRCHCRH